MPLASQLNFQPRVTPMPPFVVLLICHCLAFIGNFSLMCNIMQRCMCKIVQGETKRGADWCAHWECSGDLPRPYSGSSCSLKMIIVHQLATTLPSACGTPTFRLRVCQCYFISILLYAVSGKFSLQC